MRTTCAPTTALAREEDATLFDRRMIYVKPVVQRTDGYEDWELASWDREVLMRVMDNTHFEMELQSITKLKKADMFLPQVQPGITNKQRETIKLALKEGYYNYPRNTDLNELAKIAGITKQGFQENLRRAENNLIPFLIENLPEERE